MAKYLFILFSLAISAQAFKLQSGDILLQPLHCFTCSLIMQQESSEYSHVGIYIEKESKPFVFEAYQKVAFTPFGIFQARTDKTKKIKVLRFKDKFFNRSELIHQMKSLDGLSYDAQFLLSNFDEKGEKLYCSELVYKIFSHYGYEIQLKIMKFDINREYWIRFFKGNPPDGELGISPEDLHQSDLFYVVGEIDHEI